MGVKEKGDDATAYGAFREALFEARLLVPTGIDGLYLRSETFEAIVAGIDRLVGAAAGTEVSERLHFPLVVPRTLLERTDYVRSFPHLAGTIASFAGGEERYPELLEAVEGSREWSELLEPTDLALCSAGCHPLYPSLTGEIGAGRCFEIFGQIFRREPSIDPARMQAFRQHEVVYVGEPGEALAHRDRWVERGLSLLGGLGLKVEAVVANDPFFGRGGRMLASNQLQEALKIELVTPICSVEQPTAVASCNYHLDHFGAAFDISGPDGAPAHSACAGFGVERIALALLRAHGLEPGHWPAGVREDLGL